MAKIIDDYPDYGQMNTDIVIIACKLASHIVCISL